MSEISLNYNGNIYNMSKINEKVCKSCWDEEDKRLDIWDRKIKHQYIIGKINELVNNSQTTVVKKNDNFCMEKKLKEFFAKKLQKCVTQ